MRRGKVGQYILDKVKDEGAILLSLIDPDKQPLEKGAEVARASYEAGADIILVGGSIGAQGLLLDKTTKMIRENVDVPIILFPGNIGTITPYADAIYFMYMLNTRDIYWVSTAQIQGAPVVKKVGLEVIPTAYIVLEPGRAVGWISHANVIPHERADIAAATALAGEYMGAHLVVTDSGSGAPQPAPPQLISAVKSQLSIPYIYGGGCRTPEQAKNIIKAGADGIQIGTAFEIEDGKEKVREKISAMVKAIKEGAKVKEAKPKPHFPMIRFPSLRWPRLKKKEFVKTEKENGLLKEKEKIIQKKFKQAGKQEKKTVKNK